MPNVAGREFSYTPEGLRAAEQYRQLLGMSNGGAMGFRPLGYANGGNIGSVAAAAPPGHFPAYITSDEAGMLRSQGGGVAPGGGQYMANGIPAFFGGADDSPDTDGSSAGGGGGSTGDPSDPSDESGNIEGGDSVSGGGGGSAVGSQGAGTTFGVVDPGMMTPLDAQIANIAQTVAYPTPPEDENSVQSARNLSLMQELRGKGMISEEAAVAQMGLGISEGGLGSQSPGGSAANNAEVAPSLDQIAAINQSSTSPNIGYSINNPQPTPAGVAASKAFAQVNPTLTNVVFGLASLAPGFLGPVASLAGAIEGQGLANLAEQIGIPGAGALSGVGSSVTSGISNAIGDIGTAISESDLGTAIGNVDFGSNVSAPATDNSGVGGDPALAVAPAVAPVGEPVQSSPVVTTPGNGRIFGAENPLFASNPQDFTATNLDPFRFTTSPAVSASGAFKDGGMIGYRPPGYANGGMSDDGTWAPGYANGGAMGFRPLGYANGGMPRGYADGDAVSTEDSAIVEGLKRIMDTGTTAEFVEYLQNPEINRVLRALSIEQPDKFGFLIDALNMFPMAAPQITEQVPQTLPPEELGNLGRIGNLGQVSVGRDFGDSRILDDQTGGAPEQVGNLGRLQMMAPQPPIPQMRPPPPQMPPVMNRGGIMSLRHM